ncbi:hypothetical protein BURK1_02276 [Burkholderiales bacterium]|nr:hypothetical protein BURK1_02276 [Burkholderiales bacterium]
MRALPRGRSPGLVRLLVVALVQWGAGIAHADDPATNAASLHARYESLRERLSDNPYGTPIHVESRQAADHLEGDLYGVIDHPFATVSPALKGTAHWCDILVLHLNVKDCRPSDQGSTSSLAVFVGGKHARTADAATRMDYAYRTVADAPDYLRIMLVADAGPFGTREYRIMLEAIPLGREQAFVHLGYSYAYGPIARFAVEVYLQTIGHAKVGFTVTGWRPDGRPIHVGGVRGVVERNAMRYYLAVVAHLGALSDVPHEQFDKRLRDWFAFTERYPRQLHELERDEYLSIKRGMDRRP